MNNPIRRLWYRGVINGLRYPIWLFFFILGGPIKVLPARLKLPDGPAIVVANHKTYFDVVLIHYVLRNRHARFMGKASILSIPILGRLIQYLGGFPIDRDTFRGLPEAFHKAKDLLNQGEVVALFPEGTMVRNETIGPIGSLTLKLAVETKAPVYFMGIHGLIRIFPNASLIPRTRQRLVVKVSGPHEYASSQHSPGGLEKAVTIHNIREILAELSGYPLAP